MRQRWRWDENGNDVLQVSQVAFMHMIAVVGGLGLKNEIEIDVEKRCSR